MTATDNWLKGLNPGDEVAIDPAGSSAYIARVIRLTPSGRIVVHHGGYRGESEFNANGTFRGGDSSLGWGRTRLRKLTPELRAKIERRELADELKRVVWEIRDLATLRRVKAALESKE